MFVCAYFSLREIWSAAQTNDAKKAFPARKQTVPARKQTIPVRKLIVPARKESAKLRLFARQAQTNVPAILAVASFDRLVPHPIQEFGARVHLRAEIKSAVRAVDLQTGMRHGRRQQFSALP
jgi:hypothetical protein